MVAPAGSSPVWEAVREEGPVTLARFMDLALTHPAGGYYTAGVEDVGAGERADFITAPANVPAFNRAVGRAVAQLADGVLESSSSVGSSGEVAIIEFGPGGGALCRDLLALWAVERPDLRSRIRYLLVDAGEAPTSAQEDVLAAVRHSGWDAVWVSANSIGEYGSVPAVVVANEFFDALPVHLLEVGGGSAREVRVRAGRRADGEMRSPGTAGKCGFFEWELGSPSREALRELELLLGPSGTPGTPGFADLDGLTQDGFIELRPAMETHFALLSHLVEQGCVLTIDYGEAFSPGSYRRTVRAYFRHRLLQEIGELFSRPGRQDVTADVDFNALAIHGLRHGFEQVFRRTLAEFLRAAGRESDWEPVRSRSAGSLEADREATLLEGILDPGGVGGAFKVALQVKEG